MRKMLSALSLMGIVVILSTLSSTVRAVPPITASGYFDYTFQVTGTREAAGNLFMEAIEWEDWEGTFEGSAVAVFRVEVFSSGFVNVWLRSTFTGTVDGKWGSMVIQLVGKKPEGQDWYGQWVILSGTDELVNLHGLGNWGGPGFGAVGPDIWYEGMIHFD